jgi:hypothetical protein
LSDGFRQAFAIPVEELPKVILSNPPQPQPAKQPATHEADNASAEK